MPRRATNWLACVSADWWCVTGPDGIDDPVAFDAESLVDQAPLITSRLKELGYRGGPIVCGTSADRCLSIQTDIPSPKLLRQDDAMRFLLEEHIPWSAEEFVIDVLPRGQTAFCTAVRHDQWQSFLEELDRAETPVAALVPTALLAFAAHQKENGAPASHTLLWRHDDAIELLAAKDGRLVNWRNLPADISPAALALPELIRGELDARVYVRGFSDAWTDAAADVGLDLNLLSDLDYYDAAYVEAGKVAAGVSESPVNLRRKQLAGSLRHRTMARETSRLKIAAAILVAGLCAAMWIRGNAHFDAARAAKAQLDAVVSDAFPSQPKKPQRPLEFLRQQHQLLVGTRGAGGGLPTVTNSDLVLARILAALPRDLRYRFPELRVEGDSAYLSGEVRSNADADRIAAAIRKADFAMEPLRIQRLPDQGFGVRLTARVQRGDESSR